MHFTRDQIHAIRFALFEAMKSLDCNSHDFELEEHNRLVNAVRTLRVIFGPYAPLED